MAKKITKDDIITEMTEGHLGSQGGYPYDYMDFGGDIFIASIDHDGASELLYFTEEQMAEWVEEANALQLEYPEEDMVFFVHETRPSAGE